MAHSEKLKFVVITTLVRGATDEHHVVSMLDEVAVMERLHGRNVHRTLLELEAREIPIRGEAYGRQLILDRADFPFRDFGLDEVGEDALGLFERGAVLLGHGSLLAGGRSE